MGSRYIEHSPLLEMTDRSDHDDPTQQIIISVSFRYS
jgi:hypothetical protein